jgi:hypothetical protein
MRFIIQTFLSIMSDSIDQMPELDRIEAEELVETYLSLWENGFSKINVVPENDGTSVSESASTIAIPIIVGTESISDFVSVMICGMKIKLAVCKGNIDSVFLELITVETSCFLW